MKTILSFALLLSAISTAHATLPAVAPGATINLSGTTSAACPDLAGTVIRDILIPFEIRRPFDNAVLVTGNLQDRVVRNAAGNLIFAPRLRDMANPDGTTWITGVRLHGYTNTTVSANYRTDGLGSVGPNRIERTTGAGDQLFLSHGVNIIVPPDQQRFVNILTTETGFSLSGKMEIFASNDFGGTSFMTTINGTAAPVPFFQVGPGDSIQTAINQATEGQTVFVAPGTYNETITLRPGIDVTGEDPCATIIMGNGTGEVVNLDNVTNVTFSGFTVTGGTTGIAIYEGNAVIKNNKVHGNSVGISVRNESTATLCGNRVFDNTGTGIDVIESTPLVTNNRIFRNKTGLAISPATASGTQAINNTVASNTSDGIRCNSSSPTLKNNLVVSNVGAGIIAASGGAPVLSYNNVWSNSPNLSGVTAGSGGLSADPQFDTAVPDDFLLLGTSPCVNAGDPAPIYNDIDGTRNDIGATGGACGDAPAPGTSGRESGFLFTSVGRIPTSDIAANGLADFRSFHDAPFGGTIWLFGGFGFGDAAVSEYSIHIAERVGGADPDPGDFVPLNDTLTKVRWDFVSGRYVPTRVNVGPEEIGGVSYYDRTRNAGGSVWSHENVMMKFDTSGLSGTYDIELRAYDAARNIIPLIDNTLTLVINNTPADAEIISVSRDSGAIIPECAIVRLGGPTENLRFRFKASHPEGYLHSYSLVALVGRDRSAGTLDADVYAGVHDSPGPLWNGVTDRTFDTAPTGGWESCAYQFRLTASRRTTNGFSRLSSDVSFANYAIDLGDTCTADLDGDGDVDGEDLALFAAAYGQ